MSDILYATEDNPVPDNARPGRVRASDGVGIRYAVFPATGRPHRGTVILVQGRNESIEKYFETIGDLCARGFGVLTYDLRGQGGSDRLIRNPQKGFVRSFDSHVADFDLMFQHVALPDCRAPFFVLAHSTGALVALLAAPGMINRIQRMVLTAPLIAFHDQRLSPPALLRLTGALYWLGFGQMYLGGGPRSRDATPFAVNVLTTDQARFARNQQVVREHPELAIGGPTVAWVRAALRAMQRLQDPRFLARIHIPTLIIKAGADGVVSNAAIDALSRRLRSGSILTLDGARHEIMQEADLYREQFLAAFEAFVPSDATSAG